jgi:hypothetical protein
VVLGLVGIFLENEAPKTWTSSLVMKLWPQQEARAMASTTQLDTAR